MSVIPENTVTMADVAAWYEAKKELTRWKTVEALLRPKIFKHFFPNAEEGTNTYVLPDSYQLKGIRVVNRDVDPGALESLQEQFRARNINSDKFIARKPTLIVSEYRKFTAEELRIVDQALIIKDGMPGLDIKPPATRSESK